MASHNRTGRSKNNEGRYVLLPHRVIDSPGYQATGPAARAVLIEVHRLFNGKNNGSLALSVRLIAQRTNVSKDTVARAINELVNCGLLRRVKASSFSQKKVAAEYRLTSLTCNVTHSMPTREYLSHGSVRSNAIEHSPQSEQANPPETTTQHQL